MQEALERSTLLEAVIIWDGVAVHEATKRWMEMIRREIVPEKERCVGCDDARAGENGWCPECWATIEPSPPVPAVTQPFDTGCGRR